MRKPGLPLGTMMLIHFISILCNMFVLSRSNSQQTSPAFIAFFAKIDPFSK